MRNTETADPTSLAALLEAALEDLSRGMLKLRTVLQELREEEAATGAATAPEEPERGDDGGPPPAADDDQTREQLRRAVLMAREDLAAGVLKLGYATEEDSPADEAAEEATSPALLRFPAREEREAGTPLLVLDDPSGRVELADVYEALSRVPGAADARLMNYTPHSVTVAVDAGVVDGAALCAAVEETFGRPCEVSEDGVRTTVRLKGGATEPRRLGRSWGRP